jgi:predicted alpha/beta hydrolase family esterase
MATIFIFHGVGGTSQENWFPWLKQELEAQGHPAIVPNFPQTESPDFNTWMKHTERYEESFDENSILVGHSLGGALALRLLEHIKVPLKATFLVASVSGLTGSQFDPLMVTFNTAPYDWSAIKKNGGAFHVLHTDNDPYIPLEKAETLARNLGVNVTLIPGGGHLNQSTGFTEFPLLRDQILSCIQ